MKTEWEQAHTIIQRLTDYLLEAHEHEFEDNHGGDADHPGEAPETCSYCNAIDEARMFLQMVRS
jgi:hypothetical protein